MSWAGFAAVFAAFFLSHSLPTRPGVKARIVARTGRRAFLVGYSALSVAMLAFLIEAAGRAPYVMLWPREPWHVHAAQAGMLVVCLLLGFSVARPNPFSFGGANNAEFDPARPGFVRWIRHPVLVALALWAALHVLANGDLAHVLMFGILGSFALAGMPLLDRRVRREIGAATWSSLTDRVAQGPRVPTPTSWLAALARLIISLAAYLALIALHPLMIGVPVF